MVDVGRNMVLTLQLRTATSACASASGIAPSAAGLLASGDCWRWLIVAGSAAEAGRASRREIWARSAPFSASRAVKRASTASRRATASGLRTMCTTRVAARSYSPFRRSCKCRLSVRSSGAWGGFVSSQANLTYRRVHCSVFGPSRDASQARWSHSAGARYL